MKLIPLNIAKNLLDLKCDVYHSVNDGTFLCKVVELDSDNRTVKIVYEDGKRAVLVDGDTFHSDASEIMKIQAAGFTYISDLYLIGAVAEVLDQLEQVHFLSVNDHRFSSTLITFKDNMPYASNGGDLIEIKGLFISKDQLAQLKELLIDFYDYGVIDIEDTLKEQEAFTIGATVRCLPDNILGKIHKINHVGYGINTKTVYTIATKSGYLNYNQNAIFPYINLD